MLVNLIDTGLWMGLMLTGVVASLAISFRLLNFPDLTIDGSFALGAAISVTMVKNGFDPSIAVLISIAAGGVAGVITAVLHTKLKVNKFLAGIIVVTGLYSVLIRIMGGGNISLGQRATFFDWAAKYDNINSFSYGTDIFLIVIVGAVFIVAFVFLNSGFGLKLRASCLNADLARSVGLSTSFFLIIGLFFTNMLAALSGALFSLKSSYADIGYTQGMLIVALASLTIGEKLVPNTKFKKLTYILLASLAGSIGYQIIWAIALRFNLEPTDLNLITAAIVVVLFFWKRNNKNLTGVELQ
jgi:putative ABC transport system permease protein